MAHFKNASHFMYNLSSRSPYSLRQTWCQLQLWSTVHVHCQWPAAADWMRMSCPKISTEILTLNVIVLGSGAFGRWLSHDGRVLRNGISALIRKGPREVLCLFPFQHVIIEWESIVYEPESEPPPRHQICWCLAPWSQTYLLPELWEINFGCLWTHLWHTVIATLTAYDLPRHWTICLRFSVSQLSLKSKRLEACSVHAQAHLRRTGHKYYPHPRQSSVNGG